MTVTSPVVIDLTGEDDEQEGIKFFSLKKHEKINFGF
jgi:hypothetical protein